MLFLSRVCFVGRVSNSNVLGYLNRTMTSQGPKINFDTKHLRAGDALPPHTGKLRVYNMRFCPYAHRTILGLNAKGIDYEVINVDLVDKPDWLFVKSPLGRVPAIETKEGETICESSITLEYLDEVYPQRSLLPKDPVARASSKFLVEVVTTYVHPLFFRLVKAREIPEGHITAFHKGLQYLQDTLRSKGTPFLDGEQPGYADYMTWPWFERLTTYDDGMVDGQKYYLLSAYFKRMQQDPAVSQYAVPRDILVEYIKTYASGRPDYEILHKNKPAAVHSNL